MEEGYLYSSKIQDLEVAGKLIVETMDFNNLNVSGSTVIDGNTFYVNSDTDSVGIGMIANTDAKLNVLSSTIQPQIRVSYDEDSYAGFNVDENSNLTISTAESGTITLDDDSIFSSNVIVSGTLDANGGLDVAGSPLTTSAGYTNSSGEMLISGGNMQFMDNISLSFGDSDDLTLVHNATNSTITNTTGNMVIENTNNIGSITSKLGSQDINTKFTVIDSNDNELFSVKGNGNVGLEDNGVLYIGSMQDFTITHDGVNTLIENDTGDLKIINTNTTGGTIFKLGSANTNTNFNVKNSEDVDILNIDGAGTTTLTNLVVSSTLTVGGDMTINDVQSLTIDGDKSGNASADGFSMHLDSCTFTNTNTGAGETTAMANVAVIESCAISASNSNVITTDSATLYIDDAPTAGANMTLSNRFALLIGAGKVKAGGDLEIGGDLNMSGSSKVMIPPRLTTSARDALSDVVAGSMLYNTTTNAMNYWNGSSWIAF